MRKLTKMARARLMRGRHDGAGRASREEGAILILALVYLISISLVVATLSTWATNDLNNSSRFTSANSLTLAATDMADIAIQYVRYNPLISSSQPVGIPSDWTACWAGGSTMAIPVINGEQIAVWCSTVWNPLNNLSTLPPYASRAVTFVACPVSVTAYTCEHESDPLLTADVDFDDYPPAPARSAPIQSLCSVWCGAGMTLVSWQWGSSASGTVASAASVLTFSNEPSDTSDEASTSASVTVDDANHHPVAGDTVSIVQQTGPTCNSPGPPVTVGPCISPTTSTLSAITNSDGVAVFTSIIPQRAGDYTLTAIDGTVTTTSTNFVVSTIRSEITTTPSAYDLPSNATVNGSNTFSAVASSGDPVGIASTTPTVCTVPSNATVSATVSYKANGTCAIEFTDPATGNPNFSPALPVTLSFPVGGLVATQVGMTLSPTTPVASSTTNVTITMTLENAVGAPVTSSGTTLVLSDIGSGFFSASNGVTSQATTLNVTFANGSSTATAYFGNKSTGPDTISAVNGIYNWGSASLTVLDGPASQVAVTPSTTTPGVSSVTNTSLSFQLEDQFGNAVTSSGTTTLVMSSSGNGFFANTNATTGTPTLNITFAGGVGSATAYFGDQTSGSDFITAKNGANSWETTTLTLAPGAATTAQITLNPASPLLATGFPPTTNTTVTLQLQDQFGNEVTTSGVSIVLTNSGNGFFAKKNGEAGSATLTLSTNAGVAIGYFGDSVNQSDTITATTSNFVVQTPSFND
ncbi:MAG: beta strand repeat-containing protein [Acidimicrobiales bacterium]